MKNELNPKEIQSVLSAIAKHQKRDINEIDPGTDDIPFEAIAVKLGLDVNSIKQFWDKRGKKSVARSRLPRWTLRDSLALFEEIEKDEEEDENCVDFADIHNRAFVGKVENWEHLREHYNRVRRRVSFYLIKDLPTVISVAKKDIKERMAKFGKERNCDEDDDDEEEEDPEAGESEVAGKDGGARVDETNEQETLTKTLDKEEEMETEEEEEDD